jgi:hypothetical protein
VRTLIGGGASDLVLSAVATYADGWMPIGGGGVAEALPRLAAEAELVGRDPKELSVVPFGTIGSEGKLTHYATLGIDEVVLRVPAGAPDDMRAALEGLAPLLDLAATLEAT